MAKTYRKGAVGALLDEYEKVILELQQVIDDIPEEDLIKIVDSSTTDANCKSIQTVLSHVVRSGYAYAIYIRNLERPKNEFPENSVHSSVKDYQKDLRKVFDFTLETFDKIEENQLEESDNSKKIITSWGQFYDIEQITEHAIVHILRHRRQIEKFKLILGLNN
jgi:uncharacterized damage-inducible protein DinB